MEYRGIRSDATQPFLNEKLHKLFLLHEPWRPQYAQQSNFKSPRLNTDILLVSPATLVQYTPCRE